MLEMKLHDKVAGSLLGGSIEEDSHIICLGTRRTRGLLMIAPELEEFASGVVAKETAAAKERRKLCEERSGAPPAGGKKKLTEPCGKGLGVLLAESVQQGNRPVSRELLPQPLAFPENEHVESEHLRCLSRAVRSRVVRRVGGRGWANDEVRSCE